MANLMRLDEAFDDLLRGFFVRPVAFEGNRPERQAAQFRVDVSETEQAFTVRAELPGVKKDDINISIDGDQVVITAESKNEKEVKDGERVLRTERYYGKLQRAFQLGQAVDENDCEREVRGRHPRSHAAEESGRASQTHHDPVIDSTHASKKGRLAAAFF